MAPVLTIFVGGNHEASNYLQELPFGGWVAPNIYYMGYAGKYFKSLQSTFLRNERANSQNVGIIGVVEVNGILIGGHSGIYKGPDYLKGRPEIPPYDQHS